MVQGSAVGGCRFVLRWFFAGMPFVAGTISSGVYFEQFLGACPMECAMASLPYRRCSDQGSDQGSDRDSIAADARHVIDMTPEERAAVFVDLERTMQDILAHLPPQERRRRRDASRTLDPRPVPWWKNLRRSAWPHDDAAP